MGIEARIAQVVGLAERCAQRASGTSIPLPEPIPLTERETALSLALGLTHDEIALLGTIVAFTLEPRVGVFARQIFGGDMAGATLAQHIAFYELSDERKRALSAVLQARHPLREQAIIEPAASGAINVWTPLHVAPRVVAYLSDDNTEEPEIRPVWSEQLVHSEAQTEIVERLRGAISSGTSMTLIVDGPIGSGRASAVAAALHPRPVIAVDFARVPASDALAMLVRLRREALLCDAVPLLRNLDQLWSRYSPGDERALVFANELDRCTGPCAITVSEAALELGSGQRAIVRMRWPLPDSHTRRELWQRELGTVHKHTRLDELAHRYALGPGGIISAVRSAQERGAGTLTFEVLGAGVQDNITERLGETARRIEVTQRWEELVLPPETLDDVRALIGRVRHAHVVLDQWKLRRKLPLGAGVAALFSGPPGTGKTMVAGLIARELDLELYQVDLSKIVSKWVGETEKQLARVFEAAEAGHALLLFDEADALFARRSADVKSATDRYANLEVNYLLQRVESFTGVVVLTTNLDSSIDPALKRRLASHIVFTNPDKPERARLWKEMLSTGVPVEPFDAMRLATEFEHLSGANIRNAALTAAFLAAAEGVSVTDAHLRRAARSEYRAMGRGLTQDPRGL